MRLIRLSKTTRTCIVASFLFSVATACLAADSTWKAQWIWAAEEQAVDMLLARRSFELPAAPESAVLRITASSVYKLYVNGEYVCRGPARSAPHHQSFDELDIADRLHPGSNVIAVSIHYQKGSVSYHDEGRAGLLAQLDIVETGQSRAMITDASWRVLPDPAWLPDAPRMSRFHLEVCDRVDFRQSAGEYTSPGYDDSTWPAATPLIRTVGWPDQQADDQPHALTIPWTSLVPRDIPPLAEQDVPAVNLVQAQPIDPQVVISSGGEGQEPRFIRAVPFTSQVDPNYNPGMNVTGWFLLYDFGKVVNGLPQLDIEGSAGTVVDVMCAPYIVDAAFTANIVDSQLIDRIVLSGERDRWQAAYFKPARYMGIAVHGGGGPVRLHGAGIHELAYPFAMKGSLRTPGNPRLEDFWQAAAETIRVCTTDAYTDNYRERRQYVQTSYYAALGNYWTFGDTALQRRYLLQAAQEQEANGMMPAYAPRHGNDYMIILDSNTFWLRGFRDYYLYSGDEVTVRGLLPAARKLMSLLIHSTNNQGLLENPPWPYWLDHAIQDRRGANLSLNGHYHGALEDFAEVLEWLGEPGAEQLRAQAALLRDSVRDHFWNEERGLFCDALIDGGQSVLFSEHANAMALAIGAATGEQADRVAAELLAEDDASFITRESGIVMVTPAMSYFLHYGLCRYGYVKESLELLQRRFDRMLDPETNGTLWEEWWRDGTGRSGRFEKRTRSDAQTESAFPPGLFGEFVLGIKPLKPGMREVELSLPDCGLSAMGGLMPAPMGMLSVDWNLAEGDLLIEVPEGMRVRLMMGTGHPAQTLPEGKHHVRF